MTPRLPVTTSNIVAWVRQCATTVNVMLGRLDALETAVATVQQFPFEAVTADPAAPAEGQAWYRTDLHKAYVFDGTTAQPLW